MSLEGRQLAIGNALIQFLQNGLHELGLVYCGWTPATRQEPYYPDNPYTDCPRVHVRAYLDEIGSFPNKGMSYDLNYSVWLYLRQVPGQQHQEILVQRLETIKNLLAGEFNPIVLEEVGCDFISFKQGVVHDQLRHPLVDDPSLRVSPGELPVLAIVHARA